jgi:hypothetical protein
MKLCFASYALFFVASLVQYQWDTQVVGEHGKNTSLPIVLVKSLEKKCPIYI